MCVLKYIVIFLIIFQSTWCKTRLGVPCNADGITGICRSVSQCPYAIERIYEAQVKIPMCGYDEEGDKIVCCPIQNLLLKPGVFRNYFMGSNDSVIKSNSMTCRYEGRQPLLYCENIPYVPDPPEPKGCPRLPSPKLNTENVEHFLWNKCVDYQRYFNKCVEDEGKPNSFIRKDTCGIPATNRSVSRLLGGEPAQPRQFPHMAVIGCHNTFFTEDVDIVWVGQGSLISEKFILTAAHHLVSTEYGEVRYALMGSLNKKYTKEVLLNVVRLIPYKLYSKTEKIHDIALLELHESVRFNEFVRPICLPVPGREIKTELIIAGWEDAEVSGKASEVLLTTTVMENPSLCHRRFGSERFMPETMICAGGSVGSSHRDSCMGDSGGPLMAQFTNLHCSYSIEGVVSYGSQCGRDIGVYTRVSYYLDWIIENVWPEEWEKIKAKKNK